MNSALHKKRLWLFTVNVKYLYCSILGVRCDASDEEIKRYYRKQAVLVHPDKNQQPGAEESFKILGAAFELVGEPVRAVCDQFQGGGGLSDQFQVQ